MTLFALMLISAALIYACRLTGLLVDFGNLSPHHEQFLRYIPLSVLPALITLSILREPNRIPLNIAILGLAAVIFYSLRWLRR